VVEIDRNRYVITAGHCLPKLPPAHSFSYLSERTFPNLLGPLGKNTTIVAECLFVDPVADIAILGQPDNQVYEQAEAYDELVDNAVALSIARLSYTRERHQLPDGKKFFGQPSAETEVLLLSLDGHWVPGRARTTGNRLWLKQGANSIQSGMSGSPILLPDGRALGAVSSNELHPLLTGNLPGWMLRHVLCERKQRSGVTTRQSRR
jgi:hypothetical protein